MQMLCKNFLMSEEFQSPHGHYILKKGLLHVNCELCAKTFSSGNNLKMHMKDHMGKGLISGEVLTNTDVVQKF